MIVPVIAHAEASHYLEERRAGRLTPPTLHEDGVGDRETWEKAAATLREGLHNLLEVARGGKPEMSGPEFDARATEIVHRALPLDDRVAATDDFWRYVAVVECYDVIQWRHGRMEADVPVEPRDPHFGLGDKWECFPRRLWLRAEITRQGDRGDPYELSRRGGMDFWASGVLRHLYSCSRPIARALVRHQFPVDGEFRGGSYRPQTLTLAGVRELYKRLRHFDATTTFAVLDDAGALSLVAALAEGLERQDGGAQTH